jgi:hypothetical protein
MKYVEALYKRTFFYAKVEEVPTHPEFRLWSDCRLYLEPPQDPSLNESHGCLGSVWLHNPSKAFKIPAANAWGPLPIRAPEAIYANTLNYIIYIIQRARDKLTNTNNSIEKIITNPHINIAELVYLDSSSITELWWGLSSLDIEPYSHIGNRAKHPQIPNTIDFKFLWLAWGDLGKCCFYDALFFPLTREAIRIAQRTDTDLIFVAQELNLDPVELKLPVYQWSKRRHAWLKYWTGQPQQVPGDRDDLPKFFPPFSPQPLHPQSLRILDWPNKEIVETNLISAIVDSLKS